MSDDSRSKISAVAAWQVPMPPGTEVAAGSLNAATTSPIRVGSTGTIVSLMEREQQEIKERRKLGKVGSRRISATAISRLFHSPELPLKTSTVAVSCGLPLMTARHAVGSSGGGGGGITTKLKKTQRRHQLLQRDFRTCRVPRDGETPGFLASTRRSRHRRSPSADSVAVLLDASFEADTTAQQMSECPIGSRPSTPPRLANPHLPDSQTALVTDDTSGQPCLTRLPSSTSSTSDPRSIGDDVWKRVSVRGSKRMALVPVAQKDGTILLTGNSPEDEGTQAGPAYALAHNNRAQSLSEAGSSPSAGSSNPSSGRPSSASKLPVPESRHQQDTQLVVEGRRSDATNSAHSSRREEVDVSRHSTSSDTSGWLQEATRRPSKESSPISIEELRKSLLADRAIKKAPTLPGVTSNDSSSVLNKDVPRLRIPAPEPQLHRTSSKLRELLRESPRLRELQMESPKLRELHMKSPSHWELNLGPQSLRERFSSSPKLAAPPPQQHSSASGDSPSANSYHQAAPTTSAIPLTQLPRNAIQKGLFPTNPTLKPGASSSRVLPFVKYDTDEETEAPHNANKVKGAAKRRNLEGATTPLRGVVGLRQTRNASRKAPARVSLSCSQSSWSKSRDSGSLAS